MVGKRIKVIHRLLGVVGVQKSFAVEHGGIAPQGVVAFPAGVLRNALSVVHAVQQGQQLLYDGIVGFEHFAGIDGLRQRPSAGLRVVGGAVQVQVRTVHAVLFQIFGRYHALREVGNAILGDAMIPGHSGAEVVHQVVKLFPELLMAFQIQPLAGFVSILQAEQHPFGGGVLGFGAIDAAVAEGGGEHAVGGVILAQSKGFSALIADEGQRPAQSGPHFFQTGVVVGQLTLTAQRSQRNAGFLLVVVEHHDAAVGAHTAQHRQHAREGFLGAAHHVGAFQNEVTVHHPQAAVFGGAHLIGVHAFLNFARLQDIPAAGRHHIGDLLFGDHKLVDEGSHVVPVIFSPGQRLLGGVQRRVGRIHLAFLHDKIRAFHRLAGMEEGQWLIGHADRLDTGRVQNDRQAVGVTHALERNAGAGGDEIVLGGHGPQDHVHAGILLGAPGKRLPRQNGGLVVLGGGNDGRAGLAVILHGGEQLIPMQQHGLDAIGEAAVALIGGQHRVLIVVHTVVVDPVLAAITPVHATVGTDDGLVGVVHQTDAHLCMAGRITKINDSFRLHGWFPPLKSSGDVVFPGFLLPNRLGHEQEFVMILDKLGVDRLALFNTKVLLVAFGLLFHQLAIVVSRIFQPDQLVVFVKDREEGNAVMAAHTVINETVVPVAPRAEGKGLGAVRADGCVRPVRRHHHHVAGARVYREAPARIILGVLLHVDDRLTLPDLIDLGGRPAAVGADLVNVSLTANGLPPQFSLGVGHYAEEQHPFLHRFQIAGAAHVHHDGVHILGPVAVGIHQALADAVQLAVLDAAVKATFPHVKPKGIL